MEIWTASAEDVILAKLHWAKLGDSDRQYRDAFDVAGVQRNFAGSCLLAKMGGRIGSEGHAGPSLKSKQDWTPDLVTMSKPSDYPIYMDNHATTPVDPRVLDAMLPYLTERFGNAGSTSHRYGWEAKEAVDAARESIAAAIWRPAARNRFHQRRHRKQQSGALRRSRARRTAKARPTAAHRQRGHRASRGARSAGTSGKARLRGHATAGRTGRQPTGRIDHRRPSCRRDSRRTRSWSA